MCGIAGTVDFKGPAIDPALVWSMTETLRHRGPDDHGVWTRGPVGLGHTRLSIIDLSPAGHQPMVSPDGKVVLTYNGEVYNFPELRRQLEGDGFTFRGTSDTEVVLSSYLRWGVASFAKFNGMFALGIWDDRSAKLHLARDRFGIKPLHYYRIESGLLFGSEIKALLASGRVQRSVDLKALHSYLWYGNSLGAETLFEGVRQVLPGHFLTFDEQGLRDATYWAVEDVTPVHTTVEEATQRVRLELEAAIERHLVSDVPVGVFLSGGIDSSAITAIASRKVSGRLSTYAVGFDYDRGVNELPKARRVADHFQTDHHELQVTASDLPGTIEELVRCHDVPFGDAADIPLYLLCRELAGSIKVVLQGDGGDEIFAGYRRYNVMTAEWAWRVIAIVGKLALPLLTRASVYHRLGRLAQVFSHPEAAMRSALLVTDEYAGVPPTRVLAPDLRRAVEAHDPFARYRDVGGRLGHLDAVQRLLYLDSAILLPDTFLTKVDRPTMAHSVEVRVPFLDANLTRYVMGLPSSYKVRRGQKKWLLRRALRGIVPDDILDGPKTGFGVPFAHWLRGPLADYLRSVVLDTSMAAQDFFDQRALEGLIDEHVSGRRRNGVLLYKVLKLALWRVFYLPDSM